MLERPLTTRFSHSCDVRNDCYSTVNEVILLLCLHAFMLVMTLSLSSSSVMLYIQETLIELKLRDAYEHESRSVPNLTDPSYTHIAKRNSQSISTVPDVVFRSKSENTRVNIGFVLLYYQVLCSFIYYRIIMMFLVSRALTFKIQPMAAGFTPVMKTSVRYSNNTALHHCAVQL